MKRFIFLLCAFALILTGVNAFAIGGIVNKPNFSAEYIRTLNRQHATDSADAAAYNPAGTVMLDPGFYLNLGNQSLYQNLSHDLQGETYESKVWTPVVPNINLLYRQDSWAAFLNGHPIGGGGTVDYSDGSELAFAFAGMSQGGVYGNLLGAGITSTPGASSGKLDGKVIMWGTTLGGAYKINDVVSIAGGIQHAYSYIKINVEGSFTLNNLDMGGIPLGDANFNYDLTDKFTASGFGAVLGLNLVPVTGLNIGIKYVSKIKQEFKHEVTASASTDNAALIANGVDTALANQLAASDGTKERRDMPAVLSTGISYQILPELKTAASFIYYFNKQADWEATTLFPKDDKLNDSWESGICFEYLIIPELTASIGYLYSYAGVSSKNATLTEIADLNSHSVAIGGKYEISKQLAVNFGYARVFHVELETDSKFATAGILPGDKVKQKRDISVIAIGVNYKIF